MRLALVGVLLACSSNATEPARVPVRPAPPAPIATVDPPKPGFRLPRHFVPTGYTAQLAIDPAKTDFTGEIAIDGTLAEPTRTLWLHGKDLAIREATAWRGAQRIALAVTPDEDRLQFRAAEPLLAGAWTIRIVYAGKLVTDNTVGAFRSLYDKDAYVLTQLGPDNARRVFPCLDEPDRKVPWQLTLDIPTALVGVSNTATTRTTTTGDRTRLEFAKTRPLPTYLIAFAIGPFAIVDAGKSRNGTPVRIVTPRGTEARTAYVAATTPKMIDHLEAWFGTAFPYPKVDVIVAPSFGDAMENAGAILSDPDFALVDASNPSWASRHTVVQTIGHELAHQWFGDLVTHAWWDDLWLTEAFATWMENYIGDWLEPSWHDEDQFVSVRSSALNADRLTTARRIREPVVDAGGIISAFDGITYQKGASVLRMIERHVGPAAFQQGVRAYLKKHADGVASAGSLIQAIGDAANKPVKPIFDSFLDQAGAPELTLTVACDGAPRVEVAQRRSIPAGSPPGDDRSWTLPVCVAHDRDGKRATTCGMIDRTTRSIPLERCPTWVMGNASDGYYNVAVTTKDVETLRDRAWSMLTMLERRVLLQDARRRVVDGKVEFGALMSIWARQVISDDKLAVGDALGGTGRGSQLGTMTGLPPGLEELLPPTRAAAVRTKVRAAIAPRIAQLGLMPRAGDDFGREVLRSAIIGAGVHARDPALAREAVKLAPRYRTLPASIRATVLLLAADADLPFADRLYAEVMTEPDSTRRHEILAALVNVRDPVRRAKYFELAIHPKADTSDQGTIFFGVNDAEGAAAAEAWIRNRWDALDKKLPADGGIGRFLGWVIIRNCDAARRTETRAFVTKIGQRVNGGELGVAQQLEFLDQCIAQRALVGPSVETWVSKPR